jgi:putative membrane protein
MMHWNLGWGAMMIGSLGMLAFWALLVGLVFWGIRSFTGGDSASSLQAGGVRPTPLEILHRRYASGEVSREEYETIRRDLNST